jgi:hypothetical protein
MPTLLDIIGAMGDLPDDTDGISLLPTLLAQSQEDRPYLYREFAGYGGQQSIRVGPWKAIRQNMSRGNLDVQLYHIPTDTGEQKNVAGENPQIVAQLTKLMVSVRVPSDDFPLIPLDQPVKNTKIQR